MLSLRIRRTMILTTKLNDYFFIYQMTPHFCYISFLLNYIDETKNNKGLKFKNFKTNLY